MNQLNSLAEYEEFVYALPQQFSTIEYSTLLVARRGATTALVRGEVLFTGGAWLVVSERLMIDSGILQIVSYGYEAWHGTEKLYWYDSQPHPDEPALASTHPHHKHVPPDIKHNRQPAPEFELFTAQSDFFDF